MSKRMKYYPIQKRWHRIGPIYRSAEAKRIWYPEMIAYADSRGWGRRTVEEETNVLPNLRPAHFDSCDWRFVQRGRPGPAPTYWEYVCHGACHWLVNLSLFVAQRAESARPWRIVQSDRHSTVWDGDQTLWDANFLALDVDADEAWALAAERPESEVFAPGRYTLHWEHTDDDPLNDRHDEGRPHA